MSHPETCFGVSLMPEKKTAVPVSTIPGPNGPGTLPKWAQDPGPIEPNGPQAQMDPDWAQMNPGPGPN